MKTKLKLPDPFTPFFLPWRARLSALRHQLPRGDSAQPMLHQLAALFARWLPPYLFCPTEAKACSRQRQWPLRLSFWTFLAQVLSPGSSCRAAVRQAQAHARLENRPVPADADSAYCQARARLPLEFLHQGIERVGRALQQGVAEAQQWCGHRVKVLDATTLTALDTPANQKKFPQHPDQAPGCGFPLLRVVGLFCLASGALLGWNTGDYWQSEMALATPLWDLLGPGDRLVTWTRPRNLPAGLSLEQWLLFPALLTVRLVRVRVEEKGFRTRVVTLVTTLLDAEKYPPSALAALYRRRWQVELSFRQIKIALGLEHLAVRTPAMIQRALAMHLLAYQLMRALMQEAAQTWDVPLERISFKGTVDAARHFGEALLRARTKGQRTQLLAELLRVLAADAVPERPNRSEPRLLKRRPKRYGRLERPRQWYRRQAQRGRHADTRKKSRA